MPKKSRASRKARQDLKAREITRTPAKRPVPPKKPATAYFHYCIERRGNLTKENPKLMGRDMRLMLAHGWKAMSTKDKAKYVEIATKQKEEYEKNRKEYVKQCKEGKKAKASTPAKKDLPPSIVLSLPSCGTHNEPFKYWCKTCNDWICELCVTKHSNEGHSCMHLLDFAQGNLLNDVATITGQSQASSGVSKAIAETLVKLGETFKRLVSAYSVQLKVANDMIESIEVVGKKYRTANQNFVTRLEEMKTKVPELIKAKNLAKLYDYLKKVEVMKKTTQTDDLDVKALETAGSQLTAYMVDATKPLDLIMTNTKDLVKKISALSDI